MRGDCYMKQINFIILAIIGLAIRLWLVPQWVEPMKSDESRQFDQYAVNLAEHGVFSDDATANPLPNARRTPHYFARRVILSALSARADLDEDPLALLNALCDQPDATLRSAVEKTWKDLYGADLVAAARKRLP